MSIRTQLALLLSGMLFFAFVVVAVSTSLLQGGLLSLFPPNLVVSAGNSIRFLIAEQLAVTMILGVGLSVVFFFVFGSLISSPLRKIVAAMSIFAADGTRTALPNLSRAPKEIQTLGKVFEELTVKVEAAHKKDADISQVKSDFISTAAHQLRTPLTGIRWALEALQKEDITEDQKALVKSAVEKSHDLVAIVGTLLDISSIESGKYKYTFAKTDIGPIVAGVAQDLSPLAQTSEVALFYAKDSMDALPLVNIDKDRIKWILNNLIENAIRYTPAQGSVRLTTDSNQNQVYVRVSDTGIGIQQKDVPNIFERFYRAGNAIALKNQGNGLGLYIARTIATDHGGDLNFVPNTKGPGTTFVLSLPIAR
jgi:signal transduction histidine kinase